MVDKRRLVKAARCLLGWTQGDLAGHAGVGTSTVADFERGARRLHPGTHAAILQALDRGGITFLGNGVRLASARPTPGRRPDAGAALDPRSTAANRPYRRGRSDRP